MRFDRGLIRVKPLLGKVALTAVIEIESQETLQLRTKSSINASKQRFVAEIFQFHHYHAEFRACFAVIRIRLCLFCLRTLYFHMFMSCRCSCEVCLVY